VEIEKQMIDFLLFNNDLEGFSIIKEDVIINCNTRFAAMLGYLSKDDLIGHKFYDLASDMQSNGYNSFELYRIMVYNTFSNGRTKFEYQFKTVSGEILWVQVIFIEEELEGERIINAIIKDRTIWREIECSTKEGEKKYTSIFNNLHTPMLIIDLKDGSIKDANWAACDYYGYTKKEILKIKINDINILTKKEIFEEIELARLENRKFFKFKHKLSDGQIKDVEVHSGPITINNKIYFLFTIYDGQEKKEIADKYEIRNMYFKYLFENLPEAITLLDNEFRIINVNKGFEETFMYSIDEIKYKNITDVICDEAFYDESSYFKKCIMNGQIIRKETKRKGKNGELLDVALLGFPIMRNGEQIGAECIYSNLSKIKEEEKKIEILTNLDSITKLYNREFFINKLNYEIFKREKNKEYDKKLAILFLDIDDFKEMNDTLGHLIGDEILRKYAKRLAECIDKNDVIARFGADEFIILLPTISDSDQAVNMAQRILNVLHPPFIVNDYELNIMTSIGISIYPDDGTDSTTLVRNADIAMDKSKEAKDSKFTIFKPILDREIQENFQIKNNLRHAISKDELFLNYQPIYSVLTEKIIGVEALLRWNYEGNKLIPPSKFIPIAEKSGEIKFIGEWVLRNACKQNVLWQRLGHEPIFVSVNVSVLQLEEPNFYKTVSRVLKETGMEARYLMLEITETILTQNSTKVIEIVKKLNDLGVRLAIDDFGTGYSSLWQLSELNVSKIKIDRVFVDGINKNFNKGKIIKAIISMAKSLNIETIAEGVETVEQFRFLKQNRCNMLQGYLFSKPVAPKKIESMLSKNYGWYPFRKYN
jgi:diguanylate cyclase (GGDEF)-like protein/PAS domain S-box-containing protein